MDVSNPEAMLSSNGCVQRLLSWAVCKEDVDAVCVAGGDWEVCEGLCQSAGRQQETFFGQIFPLHEPETEDGLIHHKPAVSQQLPVMKLK